MSQSKKMSMLETACNVAIGYVVALASQLVIFPCFDIHMALTDNLLIGLWFTLVSIVRGYCVRRFFNKFDIFKHAT